MVKQVKEEFGDQITFQFRHFPLVQIHRHALLASRAAEAAGFQGKFFEMHDLLYETQQNWSDSEDPGRALEVTILNQRDTSCASSERMIGWLCIRF